MPRISLAFALLAALLALAGGGHAAGAQLSYQDVQHACVHNLYDKQEQLLDELIKYRIRDFEFDIHPVGDTYCGPNASCPSVPDWFIYHTMGQVGRNLCSLRDALSLLKAFHDAVPAHEVMTVHLELKGWGLSRATFNCYSPDALDQLIVDTLGRANVFTPADLLATTPGATTLFKAVGNPTVAGAPPSGTWPSVDSLRGKFLFVIHREAEIAHYMSPSPLVRAGFVMRETGWQNNADVVANPNVLFYGEVDSPSRARELKNLFPGLILRSNEQDDQAGFEKAQAVGMNSILTEKVSPYLDSWVRTANSRLYPFGRAGLVGSAAFTDASVALKQETGGLFELDTYSGDLDGTSDSFAFAFATSPLPAVDVWDSMVATTSNGSVHAWGKGLLMARESLDPESPYFAIGRAADDHGLFLQYRSLGCAGPCGTAHEDLGGLAGFDEENVAFLRLAISDTPARPGWTRFQAFVSLDGVNYLPFYRTLDLQGSFSRRGLAASSLWTKDRDSDSEAFFFQAVRRNGAALDGSILSTTGIPAQKTLARLTDFSFRADCRDPRECPPPR
ncbi:MAG: Ca2+-dependent phosphoinositide-specific phospholipase C [Thermoanaerobaculia bacterium]